MTNWKKEFAVFLIAAIMYVVYGADDLMSQCLSYGDPCVSTNHIELLEPSRNPHYANDSEYLMYDSLMLARWYRGISPNTDLPRTPPTIVRACQTMQQIWLQGTYPNVSDGIVERTVCVNTYDPYTCVQSWNICVKNCGQYNVYYLLRTGAYARYCFGPSNQTLSEPVNATAALPTTTTTTTASTTASTTLVPKTDPTFIRSSERTRVPPTFPTSTKGQNSIDGANRFNQSVNQDHNKAGEQGSKTPYIIIGVLAAALVMCIVTGAIYFLLCRNRQSKLGPMEEKEKPQEIGARKVSDICISVGNNDKDPYYYENPPDYSNIVHVDGNLYEKMVPPTDVRCVYQSLGALATEGNKTNGQEMEYETIPACNVKY